MYRVELASDSPTTLLLVASLSSRTSITLKQCSLQQDSKLYWHHQYLSAIMSRRDTQHELQESGPEPHDSI
ncbi:hypothetical protein V6N13_121420 [Hibiscus sabdariffa]|uniref:Uncharacterized protein n=2 Tax=Hibiscus sabdariffa TaxID=183260 RepID=A0ABR2PDR0_9ROSI